MPRKCTVCHHPERAHLERALLAGASLASLAADYGLSTSALSRHHHHLQERLQEVIPLIEQQRHQEWLAQLALLLKLVVQAGEAFAAASKHDMVLKSAREAATLVKVMRTLKGRPSPLAAFHLLLSPFYVWDGALVSSTHEVYTAERRSLAENFFYCCPDSYPPPEDPADTQEEKLTPDSPSDSDPHSSPQKENEKNSPSSTPSPPPTPAANPDQNGFPPPPDHHRVSGHIGMIRDDHPLTSKPDQDILPNQPAAEELHPLLAALLPPDLLPRARQREERNPPSGYQARRPRKGPPR